MYTCYEFLSEEAFVCGIIEDIAKTVLSVVFLSLFWSFYICLLGTYKCSGWSKNCYASALFTLSLFFIPNPEKLLPMFYIIL